ncbi:MAG: thioesterase family protein [Veillonella sp.]|nr:thioesterase family protein [Veillonella sp.]
MITIGTSATATTTATEALSAKTMKSGSLLVFATPAMCALMEEAAQAAVAPFLEEGQATVGTALSITHDAPSPMGADITATATVTKVDGRKIDFDVVAKEGEKVIGQGTHSRFIIDAERFMSKVNNR